MTAPYTTTGKRAASQGGFAYMWALMAVLMRGIDLARTGEVAAIHAQRGKEEELLNAGLQIQLAIQSYYRHYAGVGGRYPARLEDLLQDPRVPFVRRHLRKIYTDPMTGSRDWGLIFNSENQIIGVYSKAQGVPLKQANFPRELLRFTGQQSYDKWRFQYMPDAARGVSRSRR